MFHRDINEMLLDLNTRTANKHPSFTQYEIGHTPNDAGSKMDEEQMYDDFPLNNTASADAEMSEAEGTTHANMLSGPAYPPQAAAYKVRLEGMNPESRALFVPRPRSESEGRNGAKIEKQKRLTFLSTVRSNDANGFASEQMRW
jgi:hypothetical protein